MTAGHFSIINAKVLRLNSRSFRIATISVRPITWPSRLANLLAVLFIYGVIPRKNLNCGNANSDKPETSQLAPKQRRSSGRTYGQVRKAVLTLLGQSRSSHMPYQHYSKPQTPGCPDVCLKRTRAFLVPCWHNSHCNLTYRYPYYYYRHCCYCLSQTWRLGSIALLNQQVRR